MSCIRYIPNISRIKIDKNEYENINFEADFFKKCKFCNSKNGFLLKCAYPKCNESFHVTCAKIKGLIVHKKGMKELRKFLFSDLNQ